MESPSSSVCSVDDKQTDTDGKSTSNDDGSDKNVTWGDFADNSTMHGIKYLNVTESPWVAR